MFVSRIVGNVKSGVEAELGPCTQVIGANASGKSSLVTATELVLTGRCEELGALPSALMELAPPGQDALRIAASLSDSSKLSFEVRGSTAKAQKAIWLLDDAPVPAPLGAFLRDEVTDILRKEPKRLRETLLSLCCDSGISPASIEAQIPEAFRAEWTALWSAHTGNTADRLVSIAENLRSELRALRPAIAHTMERPSAPSVEEVEILRHRVSAARESALKNINITSARERLPEMRSRVEALRNEVSSAGPSYYVIQQALEVLTHVERVVEQMTEGQRCIVCGGGAPVEDWYNRLAVVRARMRELDAKLDRVGGDGPSTLALLEEELENTERAANEELRVANADKLRELETKLRDCEIQRLNLRDWEAERAASMRAAAGADALKALSAAVDRIIADLLGAGVDSFCKLASEAAGMKVSVQLFDKHRSVCRVGVTHGKSVRPWRALSGAERARFIAGMACAMSTKRSGMRVVCVDDVWLDSAAQSSLCEGLGSAVESGTIDQAIVCLVNGEEREGWKTVRL